MKFDVIPDYHCWIADLKKRYRAVQVKAAVSVNVALIEYYWNLGKDISERHKELSSLTSDFYLQISADLQRELPDVAGFSPQNIRYCKRFYELYASFSTFQQLVECGKKMEKAHFLSDKLFCIPWGHHCVIIDKSKGDCDKALFYVNRTLSQGWSRSVLLNMIGTDLYEREGRSQSNFSRTMIPADSDLARQITKDPYVFAVQGLTEPYREKELKAAICANIEHLLLQMGKGVSFLGREYRLEVGGEELFIDLLFYVIPLRRYLVMEVKIDKFTSADFGQLQGYVSAVNRQLNVQGDNPAIGLLVCREHNRVLAQYLMDDVPTPLAISDYELLRILPEKITSDLPSIQEMEEELSKGK